MPANAKGAAIPPPPRILAVRSAGAGEVGPLAPHITAGEEEQPHDVDEVPVPGGELEAEVLLGGELAVEGAHQAHNQEHRADDDVEAVEAGRHEEGGAVDVAFERERRVAVLPRL